MAVRHPARRGQINTVVALSDLSDVTSAGLTARNVLASDGSAYVGRALVELDISDLGTYLTDAPSDGSNYGRKDAAWVVLAGGVTDLPGLSDVTSAAVTDKFALMADGAAYVGRAILEADISDLQSYLTSFTEINDLSAAVTWANIPIANVPTGTSSSTVSLGNHTHDSITDTNLLDKSATEDIGGAWRHTNADFGAFNIHRVSASGAAAIDYSNSDGIKGFAGFNDAESFGTWNSSSAASGFLVSSAGAITAVSYGGITEANLVDKSSSEAITGGWGFTSAVELNNTSFPGFIINATNPGFVLEENDAAADEKIYRLIAQAGSLAFHTRTDADAAGDVWLLVERTGTTVDKIVLAAGTEIQLDATNLDVNAALTATSYGGITEANLLDKSAAEVITGAWSIPTLVNTQNGNYTLVLGDAGKTIHKVSGGAGELISIPANASVAFPIGTMFCIQNDGGGTLSVNIVTDTMTSTIDNTTGGRVIGDGGVFIAQKMTSTTWKVGGAQVT